ncbi:MAG: glutamate racemase [Spirochaetaceae bacterium]|jgi:glutamate racemase|nr:glutamate racemase [Spirochaetaceae bacterium]
MDNRPILFLDSGIGGLPYCRHFHHRNPAEILIYVADRANFPYGPRDRGELIAALQVLFEKLIALFNPKIAAVVCNTATVSALASLRERFPQLPFVGTVPAIKPAVLRSQKRHIGVLGTERTIEDPYIAELAARYGPDCRISGFAAPELVEFVEYRQARSSGEERRRMVAPYIRALRDRGADALVLGCTHFLFLLTEFVEAAAPDIRVYDSVEGVSRRLEALLDGGGLRVGSVPGVPGVGSVPGEPECLLVLTGDRAPDEDMLRRAEAYGLSLRRLADWGAG